MADWAKAKRGDSSKSSADEYRDSIEDELREFMLADESDVPVNMAFKERLRRKLWALMQSQGAEGSRDETPLDRADSRPKR